MNTQKSTLYLADAGMTANYVGEDLVWGMKGWRENNVPHYVFEARYRTTDDLEDEPPVYLREKVVGDPLTATSLPVVPKLMARVMPYLTSEEARIELRRELRREQGK